MNEKLKVTPEAPNLALDEEQSPVYAPMIAQDSDWRLYAVGQQ